MILGPALRGEDKSFPYLLNTSFLVLTHCMVCFFFSIGENVEENANLVVRLLIRRPECLGPALRGEGGGLLKAMKDGVRMSEQIAASRDANSSSFLAAMNDDDDSGGNYLVQRSDFFLVLSLFHSLCLSLSFLIVQTT